jgi:SAM-dependent methyltransferase
MFSNPLHWPVNVHLEYADLEDTEYLSMLEVKRRTFSRAADALMRFQRPPARLLEVGSYAGLFLEECRDRGYEVIGVEPSEWGSAQSRSIGLDVRTGHAEEVLDDESLGDFDVVVSWDVLEHVVAPSLFMSRLAQRLSKNGYVIVSTLDRSNWFARVTGKRWPWLIPMHLHYFDQDTVIRLAQEAGLSFVSTFPHVHYTSASYALRRLIGHGDQLDSTGVPSVLDRAVFPVGFGDVRTFVFRRLR